MTSNAIEARSSVSSTGCAPVQKDVLSAKSRRHASGSFQAAGCSKNQGRPKSWNLLGHFSIRGLEGGYGKMPHVHRLGGEEVKEKGIPIGACPRCHLNNIKTEVKPDRPIKLAPRYNVHEKGDFRKNTCKTEGCGWWSKDEWDGHKWVCTTAKPLTGDERRRLERILTRMKVKANKTTRRKRSRGGK